MGDQGEHNRTLWQWTPKKEKAALALAEGKDKTAVLAEVGIVRSTLWEWEQAPEFQARVQEHLEEIVGEARRILQRATTRAAKQVVDVMEFGNIQHATRLAAAKDILDRTGVKAPEKIEHSGPGGGPIETKGYISVSPDDWDKRGS